MTTANSNSRASLLAGLRTGGVRAPSLAVPHTAAPTASSFNLSPHFPTHALPQDEQSDHLLQLPNHQSSYHNRVAPLTAAVDGPNNRFVAQQQQAKGMNPNSMPFSPAFVPQQQQMQMLQLEMLRLQAIQAQQYQAELIAQAQLQQQIQLQQQQAARERRTSIGFNPPATAGPLTNSFDLRQTTLRRANQADHLRSQLGVAAPSEDQVPMTAAIGGRFGSRSTSLNVTDPPPTPGMTTVISGGTSLGNMASNNIKLDNPPQTPSKSESASTWRRGGNNNSVLSGNRAVSSPSVKVTPPAAEERVSPPLLASSPTVGPKFRPQPLRFNAVVSQPLPAVAVDNTTDEETDETHSSGSSVKSGASNSSPTTPRSSSSNEMPLSPREEASKRLYEGLGIGRPVSSTLSDQQPKEQTVPFVDTVTVAAVHRVVSQPTRQPRGPPSGADELGPKNFATRIRRKAIGGLGALMGARERREIVEAF